MDIFTVKGSKEPDLLKRIIGEFIKDYQRPLNYSQLAMALKVNRQLITGAINILHELGLLTCIHQRPTNKLFLLHLPFDYGDAIIRLRQTLAQSYDVPKDIHMLVDADSVLESEGGELAKSYLESQKKDFSEDEWVQAVDPLIKLVLTPAQIEEYCKIIQESQESQKPYPLLEKLEDDLYSTRLGQSLPASIRFKLVATFHALFEYGQFQFSNAFLQSYLKSKLND